MRHETHHERYIQDWYHREYADKNIGNYWQQPSSIDDDMIRNFEVDASTYLGSLHSKTFSNWIGAEQQWDCSYL